MPRPPNPVRRLQAIPVIAKQQFAQATQQSAQRMQQLLLDRGFDVVVEESDWIIPPEDARMVGAMLDGIAWAASEAAEHAGVSTTTIAGWYRDRKASLKTCGLRVGHIDLLAIPKQLVE